MYLQFSSFRLQFMVPAILILKQNPDALLTSRFPARFLISFIFVYHLLKMEHKKSGNPKMSYKNAELWGEMIGASFG